jgi:hypothetical protein
MTMYNYQKILQIIKVRVVKNHNLSGSKMDVKPKCIRERNSEKFGINVFIISDSIFCCLRAVSVNIKSGKQNQIYTVQQDATI